MNIGQQLTIPHLKAHLAQTHNAIGIAGELMVARALEASGYRVDVSHQRGDLTVILPTGEILYIEVKTARRNTQGHYAFTLYKHWQGRQCTDHRQADLVILLCVLRTGDAVPFVVPVSAIGDRRAVAISSFPTTYCGWLAKYRQAIRGMSIEGNYYG